VRPQPPQLEVEGLNVSMNSRGRHWMIGHARPSATVRLVMDRYGVGRFNHATLRVDYLSANCRYRSEALRGLKAERLGLSDGPASVQWFARCLHYSPFTRWYFEISLRDSICGVEGARLRRCLPSGVHFCRQRNRQTTEELNVERRYLVRIGHLLAWPALN
jgi:hypothetical protein